MSENRELFELIINSMYFKSSIWAIITTLFGWLIFFLKATNKKINDAATKKELSLVKDEAFKYTERHMKIHEDKQILELCAMNKTIDNTHEMVEFLYQNEIKRNKK